MNWMCTHARKSGRSRRHFFSCFYQSDWSIWNLWSEATTDPGPKESVLKNKLAMAPNRWSALLKIQMWRHVAYLDLCMQTVLVKKIHTLPMYDLIFFKCHKYVYITPHVGMIQGKIVSRWAFQIWPCVLKLIWQATHVICPHDQILKKLY